MAERQLPKLGWQPLLVTTFEQGYELYNAIVDAGYQVNNAKDQTNHTNLPDFAYFASNGLQRTIWFATHKGAQLWLQMNAPTTE